MSTELQEIEVYCEADRRWHQRAGGRTKRYWMALRYMKSDDEQQTKVAEGVARQLATREQLTTVASLDERRASNQ